MIHDFNGRRANTAREAWLQRQWEAGARDEALIIECAAFGLISHTQARAELLLHYPHWAPRMPNPQRIT
jgi:hypothetical protein